MEGSWRSLQGRRTQGLLRCCRQTKAALLQDRELQRQSARVPECLVRFIYPGPCPSSLAVRPLFGALVLIICLLAEMPILSCRLDHNRTNSHFTWLVVRRRRCFPSHFTSDDEISLEHDLVVAWSVFFLLTFHVLASS